MIDAFLKRAGVPAVLWPEARASLAEAKRRSHGLLWGKWKVRLFRAGCISKLLDWSDERLLDVRPDLAGWDVAPMVNITAHGDNAYWNPETGRPEPGQWMNANPASVEYPRAVDSNYWMRGAHPRSRKSRKAWYRRNAGEYIAWQRGEPVSADMPAQTWASDGVTVRRRGDVWQVKGTRKLLGKLRLKFDFGFELGNLFSDNGTQLWYPIPGHDLRAPVTWSILPRWGK